VAVEVEGRDSSLDANAVRRKLEQVPGVSRVIPKAAEPNHCSFEVESLQGRSVRAELARAVVEAGWNLIELRPVAFSLEEIFLQLTAAEEQAAGGAQ
jgi:ABC-2 type transport system ATP-binding protein